MSESAGYMQVSGSTEIPKNNDYFHPKIEDIHVGYECEVLPINESYGWLKGKLQFRKGYEDKGNPHSLYNLHPFWYITQKREGDYGPITILVQTMEQIRTPYLTFDKIMEEGWFLMGADNTDYRHYWFVKGRYRLRYLPMMPYNISCYLQIVCEGNDNFEFNTVFKGKCNCINDFRTILKLL